MYKSKINTIFERVLLALYLSVFVRQYLWFLNGFCWWIISLLVSISLVFHCKGGIFLPGERRNNNFFLIIVLTPLFLMYMLRFAYPDASWDVVNYHFLNGERAIRGFPFAPGDFMYLSYSNPIGDMLTTAFRYVFGLRLGTVINLLAVIWTAIVMKRIIARHLTSDLVVNLIVVSLLLFEGVAYEISNYWIDLLALPLILLILEVLLNDEVNFSKYAYAALLIGMTIGLKLTNLYFALPLCVVLLSRLLAQKSLTVNEKLRIFFAFILIAILPLIPYHVYIYTETGNPIYPHFNTIFKSPYASLAPMFDGTLGPNGMLERLFWPLVMVFKSERLSPTPVWPIVTFVGYIASLIIAAFAVFRSVAISRSLRDLICIFLAYGFLWGFISGDFRYVTSLELVAGLTIVIAISELTNNKKKSIVYSFTASQCAVTLLLIFLLIKVFISTEKIAKYEWAGRPSFFDSPRAYVAELNNVLIDRSLHEYLPEKTKKSIVDAEVWLSSSPVVSGYMVLLNNNIPYVDFHHLSMRGISGLAKLNDVIEFNGEKKYYSLINPGTLGLSLDWSINELINGGFYPLEIEYISVPFFSSNEKYKYKFALVQVVPIALKERVQYKLTASQISLMNNSLVLDVWSKTCSSLETGSDGKTWRWCSKEGDFTFVNYSDTSLLINFDLSVETGFERYSNFSLYTSDKASSFKINNASMLHKGKVVVAPYGNAFVKFATDSEKVLANNDPRDLYLRFTKFNFKVSEIEK